MSTFDAVLAQYEKNKNATSGNANKVSQEDRMKKYFTTVLPKGSKGEERRIRILPTKDGSSPFVEVKFHEVQVDGKWVKLYDPAQEGLRSPLNEVYEALDAAYDSVAERLIGLHDSTAVPLMQVLEASNMKLKQLPQDYKDNAQMFQVLLQLENEMKGIIEEYIKSGQYSQGTVNMLAQLADDSEMRIYKIWHILNNLECRENIILPLFLLINLRNWS